MKAEPAGVRLCSTVSYPGTVLILVDIPLLFGSQLMIDLNEKDEAT